jgi:hypothetical protein
MKTLLTTLVLILLSISTFTQDIDQEPFTSSWETPGTIKLKHYNHGLKYWSKPSFLDHVSAFPSELDSSKSYEYFYHPRLGQGGTSIALLISFTNPEEAEKYFIKHSKNYSIKLEWDRWLKFDFSFTKNFKLSTSSQIRMYNYPNQSGKETELGIQSGIALNKEESKVMIWAYDQR